MHTPTTLRIDRFGPAVLAGFLATAPAAADWTSEYADATLERTARAQATVETASTSHPDAPPANPAEISATSGEHWATATAEAAYDADEQGLRLSARSHAIVWQNGDGTGDVEAVSRSTIAAMLELDAETTRRAEAIEAYERAIELDPDYADAYCNLGAVRYNQGQRAEAKRAFEACLSREADHVEANFNLANVLEEEGDDRGALAHYRRALAADPLYPDLHINLALLYEKLGREKPAHDHWRRYLQLDPEGPWSEVARGKLDRTSDLA